MVSEILSNCGHKILWLQGHAVKLRDETVGSFHMLGLILQQSGAGLIVKPLHEPHAAASSRPQTSD
jgi:hypothetical protein